MTAPHNLRPVKAAPLTWYTPQEVGNMAGGMSSKFIRDEIAAGALKAEYCLSQRSRFGRWKIRHEDAAEYIARLHAKKPTQPAKPAQPTKPTGETL